MQYVYHCFLIMRSIGQWIIEFIVQSLQLDASTIRLEHEAIAVPGDYELRNLSH